MCEFELWRERRRTSCLGCPLVANSLLAPIETEILSRRFADATGLWSPAVDVPAMETDCESTARL